MTQLLNDRLRGVSGAVAIKAPARVASTDALTLEGLQTVDGVALAAGDRVLVKNQANAAENGVYVADSGAWARAPDFDGARDVVAGTRIFVARGAMNAAREFAVDAIEPIAIGQTALEFLRLAAAIQSTSVFSAETATAAAGQKTFALAHVVGASFVTVNGLVVDPADYQSVDGSSIVFAEGLNAGDIVAAHSLNQAGRAAAAFAARVGATVASQTGAGGAAAVLFDIETYDDGQCFDASTGVMTAPTTGLYQLNAAVTLTGMTAAANDIAVTLAAAGVDHVARHMPDANVPSTLTLAISVLIEMASGDTARVLATVAGEAGDVVGVAGGSDRVSHFSGYLVR